jgi:hypothetical protein
MALEKLGATMRLRSTTASRRTPGKTSLIVDGLPSSFNDHQLHDLFAMYGTVVSAQMVQVAGKPSAGIGCVKMSSRAEGNAAVAALNGSRVHGKLVLVFFPKDAPQ